MTVDIRMDTTTQMHRVAKRMAPDQEACFRTRHSTGILQGNELEAVTEVCSSIRTTKYRLVLQST